MGLQFCVKLNQDTHYDTKKPINMSESVPAPVPAAKTVTKKTTPKKTGPSLSDSIQTLLAGSLKSRQGASLKKIVAGLQAQGFTNLPAIKRSLKALIEKDVLVAATGKGLNGSIKINPEESARRKKAAAAKAKAVKAKKSRRRQEEEGRPSCQEKGRRCKEDCYQKEGRPKEEGRTKEGC